MRFRHHHLASLVPLTVLGLTACGSFGPTDSKAESTGVARIAISTVPSDVGCARITASSDRTVTSDFSLTPGASALLTMPGVPVGLVQFAATTFREACPIATNAVATWITPAPTTVDVASGAEVDVAIELVPNASAHVSLDFDGGAALEAGPDATAPGTCATATTRQSVASTIALPPATSQLAFDVNGDGKPDNQYAAHVAVMNGQGLAMQDVEDGAVVRGAAVLLLTESSADATFVTDATCARATLVDGLTPPTMDFSGHGQFTANPQSTPAAVSGPLASGTLVTSAAPGSVLPVVSVGLAFAGAVVQVPVHVVRVAITSTNGAPTSGQVNGVIPSVELSSIVMPGIATQLEARVERDPTSTSSQQLLALFDVGGCANPDGTSAASGDGRIDVCEVTSSAILGATLAPDVGVFDSLGKYTLVNGAGAHDALSVGFGFTAVGATF